jgi:hypothetical protein
MRLVRTGVYRCTICDDTIFADSDRLPIATYVEGGRGNTIERIITAGDVEIHRCIYATAGCQAKGSLAHPISGLMLFEQRRSRVRRSTRRT